MSQLLDTLMGAAGGGAVQQLSQRFGLSEEQTSSAIGQLFPALMAGLQHNASQEGGMDSLVNALAGGNHAQYVENPELLGQESTVADGNAILGHIFGSKDVSRAVAGQASQQTGIGAEILKQMLPLVATMVMGGLSKHTQAASASSVASEAPAGGFLASLLDQNRDGSIADDVLGMVGRFLGRR